MQKHRYAVPGILLLCLLAALWHFRTASYTLRLDPEMVSRIEITYHGDTALVTDPAQMRAISENFTSLTLQGTPGLSTGGVYRVKFLDGTGKILVEATVNSEDALQGRKVVAGEIDMALLQTAFAQGAPKT